MIDNSMLGKDGLTVTSANHLANIAKELYEAAESRLEGLRFYNKDFLLAVNGSTYRVENESERSELDTLAGSLKEIGSLKALIAFLREAIKAKEKLATDNMFDKHIEELVKEGRNDLKLPERQKETTFEDEFSKLNAEQKAKYFALEARCATIGKYIHPDGPFAVARKSFFEHTKNPTTVTGRGQDAEVNTFSSSFKAEDIDGVFFALQREHRNVQAEFNKMKADIDEKVAAANKAAADEYLNAAEICISAKKVERLKWDAEVKALKVVIPQNLKAIYEKVNGVASAK